MASHHRFSGQVVLVVGASGGLGSAFAHALATEGAILLLAGRQQASLQAVAQNVNAKAVLAVDLADPQSIQELAQYIGEQYPEISVIVNATGYDVRKPYADHTLEEVDQSLDINLRGSMLLTYAFLPILHKGMIVHMGGFADGRLVFPYYTADSASRAGLKGFIDAINLEIKGSGTTVCYFCPSPADTLAERPFHTLWHQMGIRIVSPEKVAQELLDTIMQKKTQHVMGGLTTRLFARFNAAFPGAANCLVMDRYTQLLRTFFTSEVQARPSPNQMIKWLGIGLITLSFLLYGVGLFLLPFISFSTETKALLSSGALISGEAVFWVGVLLVGKEAAAHYRQWFNPCRYLRRR